MIFRLLYANKRILALEAEIKSLRQQLRQAQDTARQWENLFSYDGTPQMKTEGDGAP